MARIDAIDTVISGPSSYSGTVATSADGAIVCEGTSSPFSVTANRTTAVDFLLACNDTSEAGAVLVSGSAFDCATWHTAIANPASAPAGGSIGLVGYATGPDPGAIT